MVTQPSFKEGISKSKLVFYNDKSVSILGIKNLANGHVTQWTLTRLLYTFNVVPSCTPKENWKACFLNFFFFLGNPMQYAVFLSQVSRNTWVLGNRFLFGNLIWHHWRCCFTSTVIRLSIRWPNLEVELISLLKTLMIIVYSNLICALVYCSR